MGPNNAKAVAGWIIWTKWQARELKTVDVSGEARYLKLTLLGCHINRENLFNQVGFVALSIFGKKISGGGAKHKIEKAKESPGKIKEVEITLPPDLDEKSKKMILDIVDLKKKAVDKEDFAGAKGLRDAEVALKRDAVRLVQMVNEKYACVEAENYERAHHCKEEIEKIRIIIKVSLNV